MKMICRKFPKTASLLSPVIQSVSMGFLCPLGGLVRLDSTCQIGFHRYRQAMTCRHEEAIILANKSYCHFSKVAFHPRLWPTVFLTLPANFTAVVIERSAAEGLLSTVGKSVP